MSSSSRDGSPPPRPAKPPATDATHRIAKLMARAGVASRREIERMITEGRVALNNVTIDTPATLLPNLDGVTVDGNAVAAAEPTRLFLFHKPMGVLTAERDPTDRPTIYDRLPSGLPRLIPVGRLDYNTEGLLLMTTDGGLKRQLELPATGVERAYRARAYGKVSQPQLEDLIEGIEIEGIRYGPIDANIERRTGANVWIEMILKEGKNREVRRVLEHLGLEVSRLIRTRYGPFLLGDLKPGQIGEVRPHDVESFRADPTRRDLPQPARQRSVAPVAPIAPPRDAVPKNEPEGRLKRAKPTQGRARAAAPSAEPRRRADGSIATRGGGAGASRNDRTRSFREMRADDEPTPRPGQRPVQRPAHRPAQQTGPRSSIQRPDNRRSNDLSAPAQRSAADRPTGNRGAGRNEAPRVSRSDGACADRPRVERSRAPGGTTANPRAETSRSDRQRPDHARSGTARPDRQRRDDTRSGGSRVGGSGGGSPRATGSRSASPASRPTGPRKPGPRKPGGGNR